MQKKYIKTKLNIPSTSDKTVYKEDIFKNLDTSQTKKLITISAPAGFGKTTAIVNWIERNQVNSSWLSLSESDNTLKIFMTYVVRAINKTFSEWGNSIISILENSEKVNLQYVSELIINEIVESANNFYLIIDDFHLIQDKEIESFLENLLKNTRDNFHLYLLSRYQIKLPSIPKYKLENKLLEMNINDFEFKVDEIKYLFSKNNYNIKDDLAKIIYDKTKGWILCIKMILLSVKTEIEIERFINNFSVKNKDVFDYFFYEVLNQLDETQKIFLLKTSLANKFNPEIAEYLTGFDNIYQIISTLENKNLFLIALDKYQEWYRYHYFFQETLQEYFKITDFKLFKDTHKKIYKWCYENNDFSEAIIHAIKTNEIDFIFESVETIFSKCLLKGEILSSRVIEKVPEEIQKRSAFFSIYKAWISASDYQIELSENFIKLTNKLLDNYEKDKQELLKFFIKIVQIIISAKQSNSFLLLKYINKLKKSKIELNAYWLASIYNYTAYAHILNCDFDKAIKNLNKAVFYFQKSDNVNSIINTKSFIARVLFLLGELHESEKYLLEVIDLANKFNLEKHPDLLPVFTDLATIYSYYCDKNKVYEYLEKFNNLKSEKFSSFLIYAYVVSINIKFSFLDLDNLENLINEFEKIIIKENLPSFNSILVSFKLRLDIFNKNFSNLQNWIDDFTERFEKIFSSPETINMNQITYLYNEFSTFLMFFMFQKKYLNLSYFIDKMLLISEKFNIVSITLDLKIKKTIILKNLGKDKLAEELFLKSLELAEKNDFVSLYAYDFDIETIKSLINSVIKRKLNSNIKNFIKKINTAIKIRKIKSNKEKSKFKNLSPKEKDIINLLLKKFSYKQISEEFNLSINTVKSHIKHIYKKLDIKNRKELINYKGDI